MLQCSSSINTELANGALIESLLCLALGLAPYVEKEIGRLMHGSSKFDLFPSFFNLKILTNRNDRLMLARIMPSWWCNQSSSHKSSKLVSPFFLYLIDSINFDKILRSRGRLWTHCLQSSSTFSAWPVCQCWSNMSCSIGPGQLQLNWCWLWQRNQNLKWIKNLK